MYYRKKPLQVRAVVWNSYQTVGSYPEWVQHAIAKGMINGSRNGASIETFEGTVHCNNGDYVVCGIHGELYPCKKEIFEDSYEEVEEDLVKTQPATLSFAYALNLLLSKKAKYIARTGWNGKGQYVWFTENMNGMMPCLALHNAQGQNQPGWVPSQGDMVATDWVVINDSE